MIEAVCKGGPLDGKLIAQPNYIYEFRITDGFKEYKYKRYTFPDYFRGDLIEWKYVCELTKDKCNHFTSNAFRLAAHIASGSDSDSPSTDNFLGCQYSTDHLFMK